MTEAASDVRGAAERAEQAQAGDRQAEDYI